MDLCKVYLQKNLPGLQLFIFFLFAIFLLLFRVYQFNSPDILMDDAFISFRYAVNWARGMGLVYNPGERVEGYTNFLWVILLGICVRAGIDIVLASKVLSFLAAAGTIAVLFLFQVNPLNPNRGSLAIQILPAMLFASIGSQARYVVSGMETLLFTFLLTLAAYTYLYTNRPLLAGLLFALLGMTRPEGMLYFVLALLCQIRGASFTKDVLRFAGAFAGLYGIYFLGRYLYYGYPFPNTFYAKVGGLHWIRMQRGWELLCQVLKWWCIWPVLGLAVFELGVSLSNSVGLRMPILRPASAPSRESLPVDIYKFVGKQLCFFITSILATAAYFVVVGGDFIVWFGPRFLIPVLPMLLLLSAGGLQRVSEFRPVPVFLQRVLRWILLGTLIFCTWRYSWPSRFFSKNAFSVQMRGWTEMGHWIATNTPEDAIIATDAAGLIPFYSGRYSIDMFGLTDLHIAHLEIPITEQSIVAHEKYDPQYILQRKPDYIISTWMDSTGRAVSAGLPFVEEEFNRCYKLIAVAKVRHGPPTDGRWIIVTSSYAPELYEQGYVTGLFQYQCSP